MVRNGNKRNNKEEKESLSSPLQYLNNRTTHEYDEYKRVRNRVNARVRELKTKFELTLQEIWRRTYMELRKGYGEY